MDPLDDDELIDDQSYIPSMWEATKYGRHEPGHGEGVGPHAACLTPEERPCEENERKGKGKARAQTTASSS
eukprot:3371563-Prorocentrum_lima.AAC.1